MTDLQVTTMRLHRWSMGNSMGSGTLCVAACGVGAGAGAGQGFHVTQQRGLPADGWLPSAATSPAGFIPFCSRGAGRGCARSSGPGRACSSQQPSALLMGLRQQCIVFISWLDRPVKSQFK